jgi:DNA-directed RNA polymerase subunit RPC12/RpoP
MIKMNQTENKLFSDDGRAIIPCLKCGEKVYPHIVYTRKLKVVHCPKCDYRFNARLESRGIRGNRHKKELKWIRYRIKMWAGKEVNW